MLSPTLELYYKIEKARNQGIDAFSLSNPIFDSEDFDEIAIKKKIKFIDLTQGIIGTQIKMFRQIVW